MIGPKATKLLLIGVESWDMSRQELGPAEAVLMSELLRSDKINAGISSLDIFGNEILGQFDYC